METAKKGYLDISKLLVNKGADVNAEDISGGTALMRAAYKGKLDVAQLLIKKGADLNAKDAKGRTALSIAVYNGEIGIAKLLIENGAAFNARRSYKDDGIYHVANISFGNCIDVKSIMERIFGIFVNSCMSRMAEWNLTCCDLAFKDKNKEIISKTKPFFASDYSDIDEVPYAKVDQALIKSNRISFSCSFKIDNMSVSQHESHNLQGFIFRGEKGLQVNAKITPKISVHWHIQDLINIEFISAVACGKLEVAKLLLKIGANVNSADKIGQTALMWAAFMNNPKMASMLIEEVAAEQRA